MTILHIDSQHQRRKQRQPGDQPLDRRPAEAASRRRRDRLSRPRRRPAAAPDARCVRGQLGARRVPRRRHGRDRRADVQFHACRRSSRRGSTASSLPARPSATPRTARRPGGRQARDHRARARRLLRRRLARGRARASRDLSARRVQLHRDRARVRRRRRPHHRPRAARAVDQQALGETVRLAA